ERAVDNVLAVGLAKPMAFHDLLRVLAQRGRNGTGSCGGSSRSGHPTTDLPSRATRPPFQWLCERHGILVCRQGEIGTEDHFVTRVDFQDVAYPHLVYRIQSARWHGAVSHARDDAHQKDELMGRFEIVDIWDRDLWRDPDGVVATVLAARRPTERLI